jgi:uncharacterized membrane protein
MYPKSRIEALTDGIFAVAMKILVLDLRLPDALDVTESGVRHALKDLLPKFLPYVLSFYVLGSAWLAISSFAHKENSWTAVMCPGGSSIC